jgi:tRNA(adenine34) deaminase
VTSGDPLAGTSLPDSAVAGASVPGAPIAGSPFVAAMDVALGAARMAFDAGEVPVGAVVLSPDGSVLAVAGNERETLADPTAHAEVLALRRAGSVLGSWQLTGCTLVVTLEPCAMCAGAAVLSRVARVVFGAWDPKAGAGGSVWDLLRDRQSNHRPEVVSGVRADESGALLTEFFASRR